MILLFCGIFLTEAPEELEITECLEGAEAVFFVDDVDVFSVVFFFSSGFFAGAFAAWDSCFLVNFF